MSLGPHFSKEYFTPSISVFLGGAYMQVLLENDGPATFWIETSYSL